MEYKHTETQISAETILVVFFKHNPNCSFYNSVLHRKFYELKKIGIFKKVLKQIRFSGSDKNPFSEDISNALSTLKYVCLIDSTIEPNNKIKYNTTEFFNSGYDVLTNQIQFDLLNEIKEMCDLIKLD